MSKPDVELLFEDREALAAALARSVARDLRNGIEERGSASLVVSGGSTPRPFFEHLSRHELDWASVLVTLADERWVPADHEDSNERLVREHLLVEQAAAARLIGLVNDAPTPEEGRDACERALAEIGRPFDVVVLGMGGDGHTASLFPDAPELSAGLDRDATGNCIAVRPPSALHSRMSLTLAALLDSRRLVIHITGEDKRLVYRETRDGDRPESELPIRAVLRTGHTEAWWAP
ncbi:MAG: 6-phosphogluconolactonase [bacterium]|nr:6-phosphogluconolactonase [bacterium]